MCVGVFLPLSLFVHAFLTMCLPVSMSVFVFLSVRLRVCSLCVYISVTVCLNVCLLCALLIVSVFWFDLYGLVLNSMYSS